MSESITEAARFYQGLKAEAFKEIIDSFNTKANEILGFSCIITDDNYSFGYRLYWKVVINGEELRGDLEVEKAEVDVNILDDMIDKISGSISSEIKRSLLMAVFKEKK